MIGADKKSFSTKNHNRSCNDKKPYTPCKPWKKWYRNPGEDFCPSSKAQKHSSPENSQSNYTCKGDSYPPLHRFQFSLRSLKRPHTGFTTKIICSPSSLPLYRTLFRDNHSAYGIFRHIWHGC